MVERADFYEAETGRNKLFQRIARLQEVETNCFNELQGCKRPKQTVSMNCKAAKDRNKLFQRIARLQKAETNCFNELQGCKRLKQNTPAYGRHAISRNNVV